MVTDYVVTGVERTGLPYNQSSLSSNLNHRSIFRFTSIAEKPSPANQLNRL